MISHPTIHLITALASRSSLRDTASYGSGHPALATAFAVAVVAQSSVSYDRLLLLLHGR